MVHHFAERLLNKLQLFRLDNPDQQIEIITRSPEQKTATLALHENIENVSVEEDSQNRTLKDFQK